MCVPDVGHASIASADSQEADLTENTAFGERDEDLIVIFSAHHLKVAHFDDVHFFSHLPL